MKRAFLVLVATALLHSSCSGQAKTTASRTGDLQIGGGVSLAQSDYVQNTIRGFAFYVDFDLTSHYGVEGTFHQVNDPNSAVYERTYEVGGRYFWKFGRFKPYGKVLYGRGVFNFPLNEANLAYNMFTGGGGVDVAVHPKVNVRVDYEYQDWLSNTGLGNGLQPRVITIGVAYHFPAGNPR